MNKNSFEDRIAKLYNDMSLDARMEVNKSKFHDFFLAENNADLIFEILTSKINNEIKKEILDAIFFLVTDAKKLNALGNKFFTGGQARSAVNFYEASFQRNKSDQSVLKRKGNALRVIGEVDLAVNIYRQALAIKYDSGLHSRMLLAMHYENSWTAEELAKEHHSWCSLNNLDDLRNPVKNKFSNKNILKVGYLSPDFRSHPVAYFFQPILRNHDRKNFHITCYSTQAGADGVTRWIQEVCDQWRDVENLSSLDLTKVIENDGIDILIDLAGHTAGNRLDIFRLKPAPIQMTYLGYPNGTGVREIDYRITDEVTDPTGFSEHLYVEKLIRIDPCFLTFEPPSSSPNVSSAPCIENGYITFGSFNKFSKLSHQCVQAWVNILNSVPASRLFLKTGGLNSADEKTRALDRFRQAGLLDTSRIEIHDLVPSRTDHLRLYERIDIALDPFPYNGTTTTCQALWMGIPVITLRGDRHVARVGASILGQMGLQKLVAESVYDYIQTATLLAMNINEVLDLRQSIRKMLEASPLLDHKSFVQKLEKKYWLVWQEKVNL